MLLHRGFSKRWAVTDQRLWQHLQDKYSHHPERKTVHNWIAAQTSQTHSLTDTMCPPRPCAASAHSSTALSWGYPTPVFLRVVQTDPTTRSNTCFHNTQSTWSPPQHTVYTWPPLQHTVYTWSNAHFNDVCSTQYQLLHHLPCNHIAISSSTISPVTTLPAYTHTHTHHCMSPKVKQSHIQTYHDGVGWEIFPCLTYKRHKVL